MIFLPLNRLQGLFLVALTLFVPVFGYSVVPSPTDSTKDEFDITLESVYTNVTFKRFHDENANEVVKVIIVDNKSYTPNEPNTILYASEITNEKNILKDIKDMDHPFWSNRANYEYLGYNQSIAQIHWAKTPYNSGGIFHSGYYLHLASLLLPRKDSKHHFQFEKQFTDIRYFSQLSLEEKYPVKKKKVTIDVPHWLNLSFEEQNMENLGIKFSMDSVGIGRYQVARYVWEFEDLQPFKAESNSLPSSFYLPHILIWPKSFMTDEDDKSKRRKIPIFPDLQAQYSMYRGLVDEVKYDESRIDSLLGNLDLENKSDSERMKEIFYWVQANIQYIAFEEGIAGFRPESPDNTIQNLYGDCKAMAFLLKSMLKASNIDARIAWCGTNPSPYSYKIPSLIADNHMICVAYSNGEQFVLDPTERFIGLGQVSERLQGRELLIENGASYTLDTVPTLNYQDNFSRTSLDLRIEGNKLVGEGESLFEGELSRQIQGKIQRTTDMNARILIATYLESQHPGWDLKSLSLIPGETRSSPFKAVYELEILDQVISGPEFQYLLPDLYPGIHLPTMEEDRNHPLFLSTKLVDETEVSIDLNGHSLNFETPVNWSSQNDFVGMNYLVLPAGDKVIIKEKIQIINPVVPISEEKSWNKMINDFDELKAKTIPFSLNN